MSCLNLQKQYLYLRADIDRSVKHQINKINDKSSVKSKTNNIQLKYTIYYKCKPEH